MKPIEGFDHERLEAFYLVVSAKANAVTAKELLVNVRDDLAIAGRNTAHVQSALREVSEALDEIFEALEEMP